MYQPSEEDFKFIQKYGVKLNNDPIADKTSEVFLVRHGFSEFNYKHLILKKDGQGNEDPNF